METIEVNVYQTAELENNLGETPERVVARYLREALSHWPGDVRVRRGFGAVHGTDNESHCSGSALEDFKHSMGYITDEAKDANLLLCYDGGGGCGFIGGRYCTAPAKHITEDISYQRTGQGDIFNNLSACLHEVGHNLGGKHDHDNQKSGKNHRGDGWNTVRTFWGWELPGTGKWHRTPMCVDNDVQNDCGSWVERRRFGPTVQHLHYTDCFLTSLDIADA